MIYKQEALDNLEVFRRNTAHILGEDDPQVKTIDTCKMLVDEVEEKPEIIRCKDWAHLDEEIGWNGEKYMTCFLSPLPPVRKADDFCSFAERKEE
ncbi:MAG: hypothetical protein IKN35_02150 [Lachnospiraceae bacterium]|nr:hypothetical protein [Lachnospiraceae bacterium]